MPEYARVENGSIIEFRDLNDIPAHKAALWKPVARSGSGDAEQITITPDAVSIVRATSPAGWRTIVNAERDRRLRTFRFNGTEFDFDPTSRGRIETARNSAGWAIVAGKQPGDLRWADPNIDFGWIAADNSFVVMDAPTTLAFGNAAAAWEGRHIVAARLIKDMSPIPEAYADDQYWPA